MSSKMLFNEFFVEGENQEISHVLLHIIQPSNPQEEKEKGYFFTVCEINNGKKEDIINLQTLMDSIEDNYYDTIETPEVNTLEYILEKVNKENFVLSNEETKLHCLIGTLKNNDITFSFCGQPEILLFYKNKDEQYQYIDLVSQNKEDEQEEKLFSQIIQGTINPGDYFFGSTNHIVSCFNHDRIQKIVTGGRTAEQSANHFEKVLANIKNGYSFGGFIIHSTATPSSAKNKIEIEQEEQVMVYEAEKKTARTLTPNILNNLNTKLKTLIEKEKEQEEELEDLNYKETLPTQTIINRSKNVPTNFKNISQSNIKYLKILLKYAWQGIRYLGLGIYWIFFIIAKFIINIGRTAIMLFIVLINFKNRRRAIIESWKESWGYKIKKIKNLPLSSKILSVISLIFIIVFISSVFYLHTEKKQSELNKIYNEYFQTIKNKIDAAESTSIYGDESQSKKILLETKNLLENFTCKPEHQIDCDEITSRINKLNFKLQKMDVLPAEILVDLNELGFYDYNKILKINSKILIFSEHSSTILVYEMTNKEIKEISINDLPSVTGFINGAVPKENDYALLIANDYKTLISFNPQNNELKKIEVSFPDSSSIKAISIYNRRLYSLDTANNQIYRHENIKNGFTLGKNWLTSAQVNIRDAVSMSIDGDVYVFRKNGELLKFNKGEQQLMNLELVEPNLSSGDEMWTYADLKYIYILDSSNKRLVLFDKNNKFIKQITNQDFQSPTSIEINETENFSYIIDDQKIYQIKLK